MGKNLIVPNVVEDILMLAEKTGRIQVGGVNENDVFELLYQLSQLTEDKTSFKKEDLQRAKVLFEECRDYSVSALQKMGYAPRTPGIKSEVNGQTSKIPTLLKVLWWYMSFQAQKIELNFGERVLEGKRGMAIGDQTILGFLNDAIERVLGFKLAKKTFTEFAVSPSRYLGAVTYNQIKLPYTYAGAKTDEWGYPINYLSRIVKEYDIFLDLFGGGGYATLAVNPLTNVEYYINEFSFLITVYYQVLTDESLYLQFKDLLGVLAKAVEGDPDAIQYFVNKGINGLSADDSVQNMREIYSYYMNLIEVNDLRNVNKWLQHSLRINDNGFSFMNVYKAPVVLVLNKKVKVDDAFAEAMLNGVLIDNYMQSANTRENQFYGFESADGKIYYRNSSGDLIDVTATLKENIERYLGSSVKIDTKEPKLSFGGKTIIYLTSDNYIYDNFYFAEVQELY